MTPSAAASLAARGLRAWTARDEARLRRLYATGLSDDALGAALGRSAEAIKHRRHALRLVDPSPVRDRVIAVLAAAEGPLPTPVLVERVYADRTDGGPLTALRCVHVAIHRLRGDGQRIVYTRRQGYRIEGRTA